MKASHIKDVENEINNLNDGFFSILIIGERGVGKSSVLNNFREITQVNDLKKALEENKKNPLVIDLIEFLPFDEQKNIFNLISTGANNQLMNVEKKPTCPQLIFSTQKELTELYDNNNFYTPFIDRIAQQVIRIKPLRKLEKDEIASAWDSVNELMLLKENDKNYDACLKKHNDTIVDYISKNLLLSGNFRDLEKLSIFLWRFTSENKKTTKQDVEEKLHEFKEIHEVEIKGEFFKIDKPADFMIKEFRASLVDWAEKKYSNLSRADLINKLDISEKTYYNWKNRL